MEEDMFDSPPHSSSSGNLEEKPRVKHGAKAVVRVPGTPEQGRKFSNFSEPILTQNAEDKSKRKGSTWLIQYGVTDIPEEKILADAFATDHKKWLTETYPKDSSKIYSYELDLDSIESKSRSVSRATIPSVECNTESPIGTESAPRMEPNHVTEITARSESINGADQIAGVDNGSGTDYVTAISLEPEMMESYEYVEQRVAESESPITGGNSFPWSVFPNTLSSLAHKFNSLRGGANNEKRDDGATPLLSGTVSRHASSLGAKSGNGRPLMDANSADGTLTDYFSSVSQGNSPPLLHVQKKTSSVSSKRLSGSKNIVKSDINQRQAARRRTGTGRSGQDIREFEKLKRKFYRRGKSFSKIYKHFQQAQKGRSAKKSKQKTEASGVRNVHVTASRANRGASFVSRLATFFYPAGQKDLSFFSKVLSGFYCIGLLACVSFVGINFLTCLKGTFKQYFSYCEREVT